MAPLIGNPCCLGDIQHSWDYPTFSLLGFTVGKIPLPTTRCLCALRRRAHSSWTTLFQPFPTDLKLWRFSVNYLCSTSEQITANAKFCTGFRLEVFSVVSMPCGALFNVILDVVRLKWCFVFCYEQEHPQKDFHYWASICHRFWLYSVHDL